MFLSHRCNRFWRSVDVISSAVVNGIACKARVSVKKWMGTPLQVLSKILIRSTMGFCITDTITLATIRQLLNVRKVQGFYC